MLFVFHLECLKWGSNVLLFPAFFTWNSNPTNAFQELKNVILMFVAQNGIFQSVDLYLSPATKG